MSTTALILAAGGALALLWCVWVFNRLVALGARADGAWSDIDVQLKRRRELIPALVESVRGYASHESTTLEDATRARAAAGSVGDSAPGEALGRAESELARAAVNLVAVAEAYPELQADALFVDLSERLVECEHAIQASRRYYNAVVRDLNTLVERFPELIVARATGRSGRAFFEVEDASERLVPLVRMCRAPGAGPDPAEGAR